jgi:PAS domain S-box-containing protein
MPYGSAIGFLFAGVGLIFVSAARRTAARLAAIAVAVTMVASVALDARIPPNAFLDFLLTTLALWFLTGTRPKPSPVALLGSIVAAVGFTSLFGYATRLDAAYAWRGMPAMAIHGAAAFGLIGLVLVALAWKQTVQSAGRLPDWLPIPAGMAAGTATMVLSQALLQEDRSGLAYTTLTMGGALAVALALAIRFAQTARNAFERAERTAQALNAELLERRAAEENLRKTEDDLNRAQRVARTGSWRLDVRRDELRWSAETYRMFGVPEGTPLTYQTFLAAVHPEDRGRVDREWHRALEGAPYDVEHRILVDGSVKWVHERARLEFDAAGGLQGGFGTVQDITEQREAQQALWQSEARFRSMFESAAAGMAQVDLGTGRLLRANHQLAVMTGYSQTELEGMRFLDLTHADERPAAAADFCRAASGERREGCGVERRFVRKNGQEMFVDLHGSVVYDEHDRPAVGIFVMTDLTARKRAETALRESEQRVRRKLESVLSPDGDLGTLDLADLVDAGALQSAMDDFYGVTRIPMAVIDVTGRVLVGVGWQEICTRFHRAHPDTCRNCVESDTHLSAGLAKGEYRLYKCKNNLWDMATPIVVADQHVGNVFTGQFFLADEAVDRELFRAQAREYGFDEADYLAALDRVPRLRRETVDQGIAFLIKLADTLSQLGYSNVKLARLLAERDRLAESLRQGEHFYRQTLESIPGMVFTTRPDGYCDYQSQQWVDFTGVPVGEHLGDGWNRLLHPDDQPRAFAAWRTAVEGRAPYDLEYRVRRRDGEYEWFKVRGVPIREADGKIARWFGVAANIDALKRAEEDLAAAKVSAERAKAAAESANRAKDQFIAVVSHELRTPLMPVLSGIALLRREPGLSAGGREVLDVLQRNVKAESRLIDDLLDLTRIEREKLELDRRRVDVRSIIDGAIEVCRPDLEARQLHVTVVCDRDRYRLEADAARLQQVLCNLLNNAAKFTPEGGSVDVRCQSQDGWVTIDVQDSGIGIEREALGRIFGTFDQGDRSITRRFGGLGLGLAISKALVELHGGTIEAQSEGPGTGSLFRIRLPLVSARTSALLSTAEGGSASEGGARLEPVHILLVEDHGDTADMLIAVLERSGHRVAWANDLASALAAAERDTFDLLVSDLGLPDGSGLDLIRTLRASGSTIPAIALSGYGQASDLAQSRAAGFQVHLVKPIEPTGLFEAIGRLTTKPTIV